MAGNSQSGKTKQNNIDEIRAPQVDNTALLVEVPTFTKKEEAISFIISGMDGYHANSTDCYLLTMLADQMMLYPMLLDMVYKSDNDEKMQAKTVNSLAKCVDKIGSLFDKLMISPEKRKLIPTNNTAKTITSKNYVPIESLKSHEEN